MVGGGGVQDGNGINGIIWRTLVGGVLRTLLDGELGGEVLFLVPVFSLILCFLRLLFLWQ